MGYRTFLSAGLARVIPKGGLARAAALLVTGTAVGQGMIILTSPLLTRIYSPANFGLFGLFVSFVNTASVVIGLRYEFAILAAEDDDVAKSVLLLTIFVCLPLSCILGAVLLALVRFDVLSYGLLPASLSFVAGAAFLIIGTSTALRYWLLRMRAFRAIGEVSAWQGAFRALIPLAGAFTPLGLFGLVSGEIAGRAAGLVRMARQSSTAISEAVSHGVELLPDVARLYWKFPVLSVPSSLVEALANSLPLILIAHLFGESPAGLFFLVQRVVSLPATLVTTSIADVYHTRMAEYYRAARNEVRPFLVQSSRHLLLLGSVLVIPFAILLAFGFSTIFGRSWGEGAGLVIAIAPWTIAALVVSPVSRVLLITQKLEHKLAYDVFALISSYAALYAARALGLSLTEAVALLSAVRVIGYTMYFYLLLRAVTLAIPSVGDVEGLYDDQIGNSADSGH